MVWYKPSTWFMVRRTEVDDYITCDNHHCELGPFKDGDTIAYDRKRGLIYHEDQCGMDGTEHIAHGSPDEFQTANFEFISKKKALRFLRQGKLAQSKKNPVPAQLEWTD